MSDAVRTTMARRVQRPWVSVVLLVLVLLHWGVVGFFYWQPTLRASGSLFIVRGDGDDAAMRVVDPATESWDELSRLTVEAPERVAEARLAALLRHHDEWAFGRVRHQGTVTIAPFEPGAWSERELADARQRAVGAWAAAGGETRIVARMPWLAELDGSRLVWRWDRIVHTVAGAALGVLLAVSMCWVTRIPAGVRSWRGARRLARGRCPRCGYDIAGLEEPRCPECGEAWGGEPAG